MQMRISLSCFFSGPCMLGSLLLLIACSSTEPGSTDSRLADASVSSDVSQPEIEGGPSSSSLDGGVLVDAPEALENRPVEGDGGSKGSLVKEKPPQLIAGRYEVRKEDRGIYDTTTGLVWQAEPGKQDVTWSEAELYCAQLEPKGRWRLPTIKELVRIVDKSASGEVKTQLPEMLPWFYWSSSPYEGEWSHIERAFGVAFYDGDVHGFAMRNPYHVRCVHP